MTLFGLVITTEIIDSIIGSLSLLITISAFAYAVKQFQLSKKDKEDRERPFILLDLDIPEKPICNIEIKNLGASPAKNIHIEFTPNISPYFNIESKKDLKINDLQVLKNLNYLGPSKSHKFFFGTFIGDSPIKQKFTIKITYQSFKGKKYEEIQILDPNDFMGMIYVTEPTFKDIEKHLKTIATSLSKSSSAQESTLNVLKNGLIVRNLTLANLNIEELKYLIRNIIEKGNENDPYLNPFAYDFQFLLMELRSKYLMKSELSKSEEEILKILNDLCRSDVYNRNDHSFESNLDLLKNSLN